ncbi:LysR family transcriptional regulator [Collinsella phocaeensis]|uniref:LysR family transcriptional regulator n=1 Tax=Collinsella phocaeensis TaxID=1871016 RepID=UPI000930D485|nr:LysR family transcriptional regulator [Collinsella phocaeensis]
MDEKDFALLNVLKDCQNITRAADQLYLTQSALSKRIKAIERELGCDIIIRTRKGVRFTPEGEVVLERTKRASDELSTLRRELDAAQDEVCGSLRAGFSINYASVHLASILTEYHRRYPRVNLDVRTGQSYKLYSNLQSGELDLAVLRGDLPWDGMQYLLAQERICVARAREHADTPLSELLHISHSTDSAQMTLMTRWLHENDLANSTNHIRVDSLTICADLVRRRVGWAMLPDIILDDLDGAVTPCTFANGEPFVRRMYIDCQKEAERLPQVRLLVDLIKEQYRPVRA